LDFFLDYVNNKPYFSKTDVPTAVKRKSLRNWSFSFPRHTEVHMETDELKAGYMPSYKQSACINNTPPTKQTAVICYIIIV
jgi:hypothetical protein